jgi:hypothetical protein
MPDASEGPHTVHTAVVDRHGNTSQRGLGYYRLWQTMGDRAAFPPSQALVGRQQSLEAIQAGAGTVDTDPLHDLCPDADACPDLALELPLARNRALAPQRQHHGQPVCRLDAPPIYRTSPATRLRGEVAKIRDARTRVSHADAVLIPPTRPCRGVSIPDFYRSVLSQANIRWREGGVSKLQSIYVIGRNDRQRRVESSRGSSK